MKKSSVLAAVATTVASLSVARPVPRPALAERLKAQDCEVYGIVHWGLNTYTDREWGFGDEDPALLNPANFDADQIVGACKDGGLQGLLIVAKHHDGFCLWPTKTTEHNISKSPFRGGKGDYVREMEQACRKHGLKVGIYVSPWDRNNEKYASPEYVDLYHAQIKELLGGDYGEIFEMWFDGANGGDGYYGGARERRKIPDGYYRFDKLLPELRALQPKVCFFNESDGADFRWPGNERGMLDPNSRATIRSYEANKDIYKTYCNKGDKDGTTFHPPEADFPLRPGWFYHVKECGKTKSAAYLMQRYLDTVGNGGTMNIGIAPNKDGRLDDEDVKALKGFKTLKDAFFARHMDGKGYCNVVVVRENVTGGEFADGWTVKAKGEVVASGEVLGIKRIRVLDEARPRKDLSFEPVLPKGRRPKGWAAYADFYYADPELIKLVQSATTESGETDTAKWMTAGQEGK